jgi:hypothetical protein
MVAAHDADADHADTQNAVRAHFVSLTHDPKSPLLSHYPCLPLARLDLTGDPNRPGNVNTFGFNSLQAGFLKEKQGEFREKQRGD